VVVTATISARIAEGRIAAALAAIQADCKTVAIGSYPFYAQDGYGVQLVVRGREPDSVEAAAGAIEAAIAAEGVASTRIPS
jgi:hypothetical protein